jgi:hypothetical protein
VEIVRPLLQAGNQTEQTMFEIVRGPRDEAVGRSPSKPNRAQSSTYGQTRNMNDSKAVLA